MAEKTDSTVAEDIVIDAGAIEETSEERKKRLQEEKELKKQAKADKKGKGGFGKVLFFLVFLVIVGGGIATAMDLYGIREDYVYPFLRTVPYVKNYIPEVPSEDPYANYSREDLVSAIYSLEADVESKNIQLSDANLLQEDYLAQIYTLKEVEQRQITFDADKAEFDRLVALNDPGAYSTFYEKIASDNGQTLYTEAVQLDALAKEVAHYYNMFQGMDPRDTAVIVEELMVTDMTLVTGIMKKLTAETAGDVLSSMSASNGATMAKALSPQ